MRFSVDGNRSTLLALLAFLFIMVGSGGGITILLPDSAEGTAPPQGSTMGQSSVSGQASVAVSQAVLFRQVAVVAPGGGAFILGGGANFVAHVQGVQSDTLIVDIALGNSSTVPQTVTLVLTAAVPVVAKVATPVDDVAKVIQVGPNIFVMQVASTTGSPDTQADIRLTGILATSGSISGRILPAVRTGTTFGSPSPGDTDTAALIDNFEVVVGGQRANLNSALEDGLSGFQTEGDVRHVVGLGSIRPPGDTFMALLTTAAPHGAQTDVGCISGRDVSLLKQRLSTVPQGAEVRVKFDVNVLTNERNTSMSDGDYFRAVLVGFAKESVSKNPIPIVTLMQIDVRGPDLILPSNTRIQLDSPVEGDRAAEGCIQVKPPAPPPVATQDLVFGPAPSDTGFKLQTGFRQANLVLSGLGGLEIALDPAGRMPFTHFEIWLLVAEGNGGGR